MNHLDDFKLLEARLQVLLPEQYQESYERLQPVSMGSAKLHFAPDGRAVWDEIWGSFCHLAMAGGPPHRGTLLQASSKEEVEAHRSGYREVVSEICRGVQMVTGLAAMPSRRAGLIDIDCPNTCMAGWLARAINMENVSARADGMVLRLPAGPAFRVEKEIKNVIVAVAKTCHYWVGHTSTAQHRAIGELFRKLELESPLMLAQFPTRENTTLALAKLREAVANEITEETGLLATGHDYRGWLGVDCLSVSAAVWMMRIVAVCNVICRREGSFLYVPINASVDRKGDRVAEVVARVHQMALAHGAF